jgi:hypothetical protein
MSFLEFYKNKEILTKQNIWSLKCSNDGKYILCGGDGVLKIIDA